MNGRDKLPWFPIDQLPMAYIIIMAKEINIDHCQVSPSYIDMQRKKKTSYRRDFSTTKRETLMSSRSLHPVVL
jgi:hypothetical protein